MIGACCGFGGPFLLEVIDAICVVSEFGELVEVEFVPGLADFLSHHRVVNDGESR